MRIKNIIVLLSLIFLTTICGWAQVINALTWDFKAEIEENETYLISTATIKKGYHINSQFLGNDGPISTEINFTPNKNYKLVGKNKELSKTITKFDEVFDMDVVYFINKAIFKQKIEVLSKEDFKIIGSVYFQVCDEEKCLMPTEEDFEINVKGKPDGVIPELPNPLKISEKEEEIEKKKVKL